MEENNTMKPKGNSRLVIGLILLVIYTVLVVYGTVKVYDKFFANNSGKSDVSISRKEDNNDVTLSKRDDSKKAIAVQENETVTKDGKYELTVVGHEFSKRVEPKDTSGFYTYYEAEKEGHQYLDIRYEYKNLDSVEQRSDKVLSMKIKFNDKYEYTGFCIIEKDDGDFTYSNITSIAPLTTGNMHYLFDVPDEVANSEGAVVATLTVGNEVYEVKIR